MPNALLVWPRALRQPAQLPRDARDTLFHLAVTAWTILPHAGNLPLWCLPLAGVMLLWRAHLALTNGSLPGRWSIAAVLLLASALTWYTERTLLGKEAGVTLVVVLIALKTLELRARRDAMVTFFLGFFLVLTHFLYSQSMLVAASMLISVWGLLTALVLSNMPVGRPTLASASWIAARAALLGAPLMVALFVLFPRIGPLWGVPQDAAGRTGLSGSLRLGGVAELARDESVALRVRFFGPPPPQSQLYFRGPVLSTFNGREWNRLSGGALGPSLSSAATVRDGDLELRGAGLRYEVTLEPSRMAMLPLLELTPQREDSAPRIEGMSLALRPDWEWTPSAPIAERVRFEAQAWLDHRFGTRRRDASLWPFLQLPAGDSPRTRQWALRLRESLGPGASPQQRVQAVLEHIRREPYSYTLEPGTYGDASGANAIDGFWLDRREGFCEHYAASFVFILRAMDVPARIVTGYQGSDPIPVDGYVVVRQSHAHAWAEVWTPEGGWTRVDPTAAVAPERVFESRALSAPPSFVADALYSMNPAFAQGLRTMWESLNNRWNQMVLNYSRGTQYEILKSLGVQSPSWTDLAYAVFALVAAAGIAGTLWALWDRWKQDPWLRLQRRVQQRLQRLGVSVAAHHDPRRRAALVRQALGGRGEALAAELDELDRLRYAGPVRLSRRAEAAWWWRFRQRCASQAALALALLWLGAVALHTDEAQAAGKSHRAQARAGAGAAAGPASSASKARAKATQADLLLLPRQRAAIEAFVAEVAARRGLEPHWLQQQLADVRLQPQVQRLIMPPPAGTAKNWAAYRARFIEPRRIAAGVAFWREHRSWLERARERWGVPPEIVAAIVGVETFYGGFTGHFRVVDALATLAFEFPPGRRDRSEFFRSELEELLVLSQREGVAAGSWRGSYAGAIGWPQFMPGSINRWAVDFDENGHIDLQRSVPDIIGSVAHYFAAFGWQAGAPTHYEVAQPVDAADRAALLLPDILPSFTPQQFVQRGARLPEAALAHEGLLALIELQNGAAAPSYVAGTSNFYVITRYNWSSYYAMAVIELAQALAQAMGEVR